MSSSISVIYLSDERNVVPTKFQDEKTTYCIRQDLIKIITSYWRIYILKKTSNQRNQRNVRIIICGLVVTALVILFTTLFFCNYPSSNDGNWEYNSNNNNNASSAAANIPIAKYDFKYEYTKDTLDVGNSEEISMFLNQLANNYQNQNTFRIHLRLTNPIFPNGEIMPNWLPLESTRHPIIEKLSLIDTQTEPLLRLAPNCLSDFKDLTDLTIEKTRLKFLNINSLAGLESLKQLMLIGNSEFESIEAGLVSKLHLQVLQIENLDIYSKEFYKNLTNGMTITSLISLSLRFNNIPIFPKGVLEYLPNLNTLYLSQSHIETFESKAFDNLHQIKIVDLTYNNFVAVPSEIFRSMLYNRKPAFFISNNKLQCDCDLLWLQTFLRDYGSNQGDLDTVTCASPENYAGLLFKIVSLCSNQTSTMKTTTEKASTTPRTEPTTSISEITTPSTEEIPKTTMPPPIIKGNCSASDEDLNAIPSLTETDPSSFEVESAHSDGKQVIVKIKTKNKPKAFFWMTQYEISAMKGASVECLQESQGWPEEHSIELETNASTPYIFCLSSSPNISLKSINILGCQAFKTLPPLHEQAWVTQEYRSGVLATAVIGLILSFLSGGGIIFYLIRKKPMLLKGADHVEIAKTGGVVTVIVKTPKIDDCASVISSGYIALDSYDKKSKRKAAPPIPERWMPPPLPPKRWPLKERIYLQPSAPELPEIYNSE